jgi:hypothetical protein
VIPSGIQSLTPKAASVLPWRGDGGRRGYRLVSPATCKGSWVEKTKAGTEPTDLFRGQLHCRTHRQVECKIQRLSRLVGGTFSTSQQASTSTAQGEDRVTLVEFARVACSFNATCSNQPTSTNRQNGPKASLETQHPPLISEILIVLTEISMVDRARLCLWASRVPHTRLCNRKLVSTTNTRA